MASNWRWPWLTALRMTVRSADTESPREDTLSTAQPEKIFPARVSTAAPVRSPLSRAAGAASRATTAASISSSSRVRPVSP
jgi:hypothetical protein